MTRNTDTQYESIYKLFQNYLLKPSEVHIDLFKAKDQMFAYTDTKQCPWYVVNSDNKKRARLNCIAHLLSQIPYERTEYPKIELPALPEDRSYVRPPMDYQSFVPEQY